MKSFKSKLLPLILALPAIVVVSTLVGNAFWKNSIKNNDASVQRQTYTIIFKDGSETYDTYQGLEYNSAFELPYLNKTDFTGWGTSNSGTGTVYIGYYTVNQFSSYISNYSLTLYAKYGA